MEARCRQGVNRSGGASERGTSRVKPCSFWEPGQAKPPVPRVRLRTGAPRARCMIPLESRMREIRTSRFGGQGVETGLWEPD